MQKIEKAVIFAAGFGTRMRPLTNVIPKPLLPLWDKPVIEHTLRRLSSWGVKEVLINIHHEPQHIFNFVHKLDQLNLKINFSFEPRILGTGGALKKAEWFLNTPYFWIINGDIAFDVSPKPFIATLDNKKYSAVLWLTDKSGPRTVEMHNHIITNFSSQHAGSTDTYTFCGLQLLSSDILRYIPDNEFSTIIEAYKKCSLAGQRIAGICVAKSYWADIGSFPSYLEAHESVKKLFHQKQPGGIMYNSKQAGELKKLHTNRISTDGFVSIGENVHIHPGSTISNSVIMDNCRIGPCTFMKNVVLAPNTKIQNVEVQRLACPAESINDNDVLSTITKLGWRTDRTSIELMEPRGSDRSYMRIIYGRKSAILVKYSNNRKENKLYTRHTRFLEQTGFRVPRIYIDSPKINIYAIEDVGNASLLNFTQKAPGQSLRNKYQCIIDQVYRLHTHGTHLAMKQSVPLNDPFSANLYKWERQLFKDHLLGHQKYLDKKRQSNIMHDIKKVASVLLPLRETLVHRDLQSSNIIMHHNQPVFIDFQGMRLGPAVYDLASLLCDPYVSMEKRIQDSLIDYAADKYQEPYQQFNYFFWHAAIERLVQALGAFGRLSQNRGTENFKFYIKPAVTMLLRAVNELNKYSHITMFCDKFLENRDVL